ncbi:MAG: hypothetical protein AAF471_08535 [Myxococcota bacterium]
MMSCRFLISLVLSLPRARVRRAIRLIQKPPRQSTKTACIVGGGDMMIAAELKRWLNQMVMVAPRNL